MATTRSPDLDDLLVHTDWLRRLACHLVGSQDVAEDVLQETWVAALRFPPDRSAPTRPWLAEVLRNFVRKRARGDGRRGVREQRVAATPGTSSVTFPSTDVLLHRLALQRQVAELVLGLEEPYRTTLLLRYYEGLNAADIARALDLPAGTVRWRLKEALDRIRQRLDQRHGGERRQWVLGLAPIGSSSWARPRSRPSPAPIAAKLALGILAVIVGAGTIALGARQAGRAARAAATPAARTASTADLRLRAPAPPRVLPPIPIAGTVISGTVLDPSGRRVPGATVALVMKIESILPGMPRHRHPQQRTQSGPDGTFRIESVPAGSFHVIASSAAGTPARADLEVRPVESAGPLELRLGDGGFALSGVVADSGGPVANAEVRVLRLWRSSAVTFSDADGRYCVVLEKGMYTVIADADGYAPSLATFELAAPAARDFRLLPAAHLAGRVVERATGLPVAGALVRAEPQDGSWRAAEYVSDASGAFWFRRLDPNSYQLSARRESLAGLLSRRVPVTLAEGADNVVLEVEPAFDVSGRVADGAGTPIVGARIRIDVRQGSHAGTASGRVLAVSGDDGRYRIGGLLPGHYEVVADARPHAPAPANVDIDVRSVAGVDLTVRPGAVLHGRVLTEAGLPISGATVRAEVHAADGLDARARATEETVSGPEGTFVFPALPAGLVRLVADRQEHGFFETAPFPIAEGEHKETTLRYPKPAFIGGVVRWEDGTPAAGAFVEWRARTLHAPPETAAADAEGRYRLGPLMPGRGSAQARRPRTLGLERLERPDRWPPGGRALEIAEGESKAGVDFVLRKPDRSISGHVLDPQGRPLAGLAVTAGDEAPSMTDEEGAFRISGLVPGLYTLSATHPGFPRAVRAVVAGTREVELRFRLGATVTGRVLGPDARPVPDFVVALVHAGTGTHQPAHDPQGAFEIGAVDPGNYDLMAITPWGGAGRVDGLTLAEGEHRRDLVVTVTPATTISGRVLDRETGFGIANVGLALAGRDGRVDARTDASGAFTISSLIPGGSALINVLPSEGFLPDVHEVPLPHGMAQLDLGPFYLARRAFPERGNQQKDQ